MTIRTDTPSRVIEFERCFNCRDLGGYAGRDGRRVRWRRLYRSMTPEYMSAADVAKARELGIHLVYDIRGARYKSGPLGEPPVRRIAYRPRRYVAWTPEALQKYRELAPEVVLPQVLDRLGRNFALGASAIADEQGAVLFHCRLGKDRSGVFAALLLKLVGVSDEDVIADYVLSGDASTTARPLLMSDGTDDPAQNASRVVREPARAHLMKAVLERLESEYGGPYAYLRKYGVPKHKLERLIERMLEPEGS